MGPRHRAELETTELFGSEARALDLGHDATVAHNEDAITGVAQLGVVGRRDDYAGANPRNLPCK